jgi:hypothetical protein
MRYQVRHPEDLATALRLVQEIHPGAYLDGTVFLVEEETVARITEDPPGSGKLQLRIEKFRTLNG